MTLDLTHARVLHVTPDGPRSAALDQPLPEGAWMWMHLTQPSAQEVEALAERFGWDRLTVEDVLDDEPLPKVADFGDYLFLVLHTVVTTAQGPTTVEVDAYLSPRLLVTIAHLPLPHLDALASPETPAPRFEGGPDRMLARVAEMLVRPFLPLVGALEDRLEELEEMALRIQPRVVTEVQALRRDTSRLRRFVAPQREVVLALMREEATPLVGRRARQRFSDVYELVYRTVESLDSDRLLLAAVLDTYRSAVADETNRVIKVLTIFSATLLPLTLIAGIYGMNFEHMPELEWRLGYAWALGLMAVVASGLWVWFARKGFIGGPRLRDLPRAVGMGLLHAATLPAKGVRRLNQRGR